MADMPKQLPPRVQKQKTRHGKTVYYVRPQHHGKRIRLREEPFSEAWWAEYRSAMESGSVSPSARSGGKAKYQTLEWLIDQYRQSSTWANLALSTRRQRENIFRSVVESAGTANIHQIDKQSIVRGKERRMANGPFAAKNYLKTVRALFRWAVTQGHLKQDPTSGVVVETPKRQTGFHTWSEGEITAFQARWPRGTRERVAFDVLLYTGLRRGDACNLGRQHTRDGLFTIRMEKTGEEVTLPILPELAETLRIGPTGDLAYIATKAGHPFKKESFGNWFRKACKAAGCPGSAHGLRKALTNRFAENGATESELNGWFGWSDSKMAALYTKKADRKRLAAQAAGRVLNTSPSPESSRPHPKNMVEKSKG